MALCVCAGFSPDYSPLGPALPESAVAAQADAEAVEAQGGGRQGEHVRAEDLQDGVVFTLLLRSIAPELFVRRPLKRAICALMRPYAPLCGHLTPPRRAACTWLLCLTAA